MLRLRCPSFAGSRVSPFADNKRPERRQPGLLCQEANIRWLRRCRSLFAQQELLMFFFFFASRATPVRSANFFPVATRPGFFSKFCFEDFWQNLLWSFMRRIRRCIGLLSHVVYDKMKVFAVYLQVLGQLHCKALGQAPLQIPFQVLS